MKKVLAFLLAGCMLFALCACGGQSAPSEKSDEPAAAKDTLIYSVAADNNTFDPMGSMSIGFIINYQIFECLVREESDGTLNPGLAESWEFSEDKLSITFKLREGIKFHNGDTMTAEDVAFSINRSIAGSNIDAANYMQEMTVVTIPMLCSPLRASIPTFSTLWH